MSDDILPPDPPLVMPPDPALGMGPPIPVTSPSAIVLFHDQAGRVVSVVTCPRPDAELQTREDAIAVVDPQVEDGVSPEDVLGTYVDLSGTSPVVRQRPAMALSVSKTEITADGIDSTTITGIPSGTTVTLLKSIDFPEQSEVVDDGETTLSTIHRVPHALRFEKFPFADQEITINGV